MNSNPIRRANPPASSTQKRSARHTPKTVLPPTSVRHLEGDSMGSCSTHRILDWLASIEAGSLSTILAIEPRRLPPQDPCPPSRSRKRPHLLLRPGADYPTPTKRSRPSLPSPSTSASQTHQPNLYRCKPADDPSEASMQDPSTPTRGGQKRPLEADDDDLDASMSTGGPQTLDAHDMTTPRPAFTLRDSRTQLSRDNSQSSLSLRSGSTNRSGNQSPTKQLKGAALDESGFVVKTFLDTSVSLPPSLMQLKLDLDRIRFGIDLLPSRCRTELGHLVYPHERSSIPPHAFRADTPDTHSANQDQRIPSLAWVNKTVKEAAKCETLLEAEAAWNNKVHDRILSWLCRADDAEELLDYAYWYGFIPISRKSTVVEPGLTCDASGCSPSSHILKNFKPLSAPSKMIDYCFIIRPDYNVPDLSSLVDDVRHARPGRSINHTDLGELDRNPIALSIETKRLREDWGKATLQMGTWLSAQWRSLATLGWRSTSAIQFLPGIIVQGHYWHFVASVRQGSQVFLLTDVYIGSTADHYGVYQITSSLHILKRWSLEVYWQAFRSELLRL
ncbi:hypothetical protein CH63R_14498 [Colletotrichum higginsianum IMI 349063]|uniref:PD-(D/E)XK nuclease-like domain-containing protein n=1 Tax=Colletotrichum higginsianum (strain IMI 349063) TaxID=759273 RepID=A0A1B7XR15_COLHI|nr:hypothetical protein CH63R_14498 [Colletotrichum higginsianum IMI 349063]OBR02197.1 hypothetical protein CH63R_14498 [Colletotrichum higginsianum IMI 349063]